MVPFDTALVIGANIEARKARRPQPTD